MTNRKLAYIVKDQKPLVLAESETAGRACALMCEHGAGSVLVVGKEHHLTGIFTGRDAVRLIAKGRAPGEVKLAKAMTEGPVSVRPDCTAIEALKAMAAGGFRHVPVTDDHEIVGVVSKGDFKGMEFEAFLWRELGGGLGNSADRRVGDIIEGKTPLIAKSDETVKHVCQTMLKESRGFALVTDACGHLKGIFTGRDAVKAIRSGIAPEATAVSKAMTGKPVTIASDARAIEALRAMCDGGFRHLPVVAEGKVLGVVTRADFTGYEIDQLDEQEHLRECIW
ncbi:MAG TPA: CBS domain-containing protein [Hyphomicrobiaceae bacterium]|nr:CBS domain-containing protein [Hyphomicrobiaceae bacterium]